jgi:3-oxoacyl-[acyl-carrier-protein] synthase-3
MPNGREVFKRAVVEMANACRQLLEKSGLTPEDVDLLIPHQANARIMVAVAERLGIDLDRAVVDVGSVGNTSAASIPIALDRARRGDGRSPSATAPARRTRKRRSRPSRRPAPPAWPSSWTSPTRAR